MSAVTGTGSWPIIFGLLSFGPYPKGSIGNARDQRDAARAMLREGRYPGLQKMIRRALNSDLANTFDVIARDWHRRNQPSS